MSTCESCNDYMSVGAALKAGLVQPAKAGAARGDVRGFNGFCRYEGFVNSVAKDSAERWRLLEGGAQTDFSQQRSAISLGGTPAADGGPVFRRFLATALVATAAATLAAPAAATSHQFGAWSVHCVEDGGARHCSMTTVPEIRVRGNVKPSPPIVLKWRVVNAAAGIVETAETAIDADVLPGWRLSGVVDGDNLLARPDEKARLPSGPILERLLAGRPVALMLVHEERGRAIARVAANGFDAARSELLHEVKEHGSNRR